MSEKRYGRKNSYLAPDARSLLSAVADRYHDGNESAAIAAALSTSTSRGDLICQAVLDLAAAVEPDERYDPADDTRAEQPHLTLAALTDEVTARAIGDALSVLWQRWTMGDVDV